MSKRFTDTEKWKKPWYREIGSIGRDVWQYLLDNCDHAGFWEIDLPTISYFTGHKITIKYLEDTFKDKIAFFGNRLSIETFIEFQYGHLNESNRVHKSILERVTRYRKEGASKGLARSLVGAMVMDMDKDKDKDREKAKAVVKLKPWEDIKPLVFKQAQELHGFDIPFCNRTWAKLLGFDHDRPFKRRMAGATNWFNNEITLRQWDEYKKTIAPTLKDWEAAGFVFNNEPDVVE